MAEEKVRISLIGLYLFPGYCDWPSIPGPGNLNFIQISQIFSVLILFVEKNADKNSLDSV